MKKSAFTMIELVMVILVLGILAALALPRLERDIRQEAADSILSAIRYTQHMALMDNVSDSASAQWQRSFWRIGFEGCSDNGIFYYIGSDKDRQGDIDVANQEAASDPSNGMPMMGSNLKPCASDAQAGISPDIFITKKYGISDGRITYSGGCTNAAQHIAFDYMGRPHTGITGSNLPNYSTVLHADCNLTFSFDDSSFDPFSIIIERETGYAYIADQPNS